MSDKQVAITNINTAMSDVQKMWKLPTQHLNTVSSVIAIRTTRHGMFSGVPIICKGPDCAYAATCMVDSADIVVGSRCPQEIASLLARFEELCSEFDIKEEDAVDMGQVKELVDLEIMMLRCDNKMADNSDILQKSVKDVAKNGRVLYEFKIDPIAEFKLSLMDKHSKILKDLNGTRASKKSVGAILDPSQVAADLIRKSKEIEERVGTMSIEVIDSEFTEVQQEAPKEVSISEEEINDIYEGLTPMTKQVEEGGE